MLVDGILLGYNHNASDETPGIPSAIVFDAIFLIILMESTLK
ncbi:MAG: hypothetical protein K0R54_5730 [Clostridiaceae bacterium]|nr:hypothetical protein [Clostridiaceae bacterium]